MTKEEILKKLKFDTQISGLSKNTQDEYYTKDKRFQDYYDKPANELDIGDIKNYLYYLLTEKRLSPGSINTFFNIQIPVYFLLNGDMTHFNRGHWPRTPPK